MEKDQSFEEIIKSKQVHGMEKSDNSSGNFNIFHLQPLDPDKPFIIPYRRRDFYKIMLVKGRSRVVFADKEIEVKEQALSFSNPLIPYKWEHLDNRREGVYCIFKEAFFERVSSFLQYEVFQAKGTHLFELTDDQVEEVISVFSKMEREMGSDYKYKDELIRNYLQELIHFGMKLQPAKEIAHSKPSASARITNLFLELLERQFPIDDLHSTIKLKSASDFSEKLNIHVNHLNRSIKEIMGKNTTAIISERLLQEAKILLTQSPWNVSEIAYTLGFSEVTHFNNFFKKQMDQSPTQYRKSQKQG